MFNFHDYKIKKKYHGILVLLIIIIIVLYIYHITGIFSFVFSKSIKEFYNYFNRIPHNAKETMDLKYQLTKSIQNQSSSYSVAAFIYITDWKYKYFQIKHVIDRGNDSPTIYLDKLVNDLVFSIKTDKNNHKYKIFNVNLNKWIHFALVVENLQVDLYYNGKLYSSHILDSFAKSGKDDLVISRNSGFAGLIYDIYLYEKPLSYLEIEKLSSRNPPTHEKYFKDRY